MKPISKAEVFKNIDKRERMLSERRQTRIARIKQLEPNRTFNETKTFKIDRSPFMMAGFECIANYVLLESGWYVRHEECCDLCVKSAVEQFGNVIDRIKWNASNPNAPVPITRIEISKQNKRPVGRNTLRGKDFKSLKTNKQHKEDLEQLKRSGINTIRRSKENLYRDLYFFSPDDELSGRIGKPEGALWAYINVTGNTASPFIECLDTDGLIASINRSTKLNYLAEDLYSGKLEVKWIFK